MDDGVLDGVKMLNCLGEERDNSVLLFILIALPFLDSQFETETAYLPDNFRDDTPQRMKRKKEVYNIRFSVLLGIYWMDGWGAAGWYKYGVWFHCGLAA